MSLALRRPLSSMALAAGLLTGCPKPEERAPSTATTVASPAPDSTPTPDAPTPTPTTFDRIAPHTMAAIGPQPGLVAGGMIHGAFRFHRVLAWLRSVPLPGEIGRELAELSQESGIDFRVEDFERRFAIPADAVITMTLLRPLDEGGTEVRSEVMRGGSVLRTIVTSDRDPSSPPAEKPAEITPDGTVAPAPEPAPKLTAAEIEWGLELLGTASGLGLHSRVHIPVTDTAPLLDYIKQRVGLRAQVRWAPACARYRGAVCVGDNELVAVIRGIDKAVVIDAVMFAARPPNVTAVQLQVVDDAVKLAADAVDHGLRGDASVAFEALPIVKFVQLDALRRALAELSNAGSVDETIGRRMAEAEAFAALASAPQLFHGARIDAAIDGENLHAEARWLLVPGQADNSKQVFEVAPTVATVPALAGLCDGALACFRTAGLPRPSTLAERLGIGAWSRGPDEADRSVGSLDELLVFHALIASWPNLLGSAARLPALEYGGGAEGAVATNVLDMIGRVQSVGGSLRSASIGRQAVVAQYVAYARTTATDAGIPRGVLSLAGGTMRDTTLPGQGGNAAIFEVPEDDLPMTIVSRPDPPTDAASSTGWVALVDAPDRMSWLLGLPAEAYAGPAAYAEIPDVARALQAWPELALVVESMRAWLEGRSLRASFELVDGEPVLRAALVRPR